MKHDSFIIFIFITFNAIMGFAISGRAQAQSSTDIYLVEMKDGRIAHSNAGPINLTKRVGYDNQPVFTPDGKGILYTSQRGDQTDIYRIDVESGDIKQITATPESEYSPTFIPAEQAFSVIRVEADGTQRLWRFGADGANPVLLLKDVKPVGYQAWIDNKHVAMFILGDPPTLQIGNLGTGKTVTFSSSIGRSLHRIPGTSHISYIDKRSAEHWMIQQLEPESGKMTAITSTLKDREDIAWTPDGSILMADGPRLYKWTAAASAWILLHDFTSNDIGTITRIAVSPSGHQIAFVAGQ